MPLQTEPIVGAEFQVDLNMVPPMILPIGVDRHDLIDMSTLGLPWRVYLDPKTGVIHDGAEYAKQWRASLST